MWNHCSCIPVANFFLRFWFKLLRHHLIFFITIWYFYITILIFSIFYQKVPSLISIHNQMIQYNNNSISMFNHYIHHYHCQTHSLCHDTTTSRPSSVLKASLFHFSTLFVHITINSISKSKFISFILPEMNGIHWRVLVKCGNHDWKDKRQMFNKYSKWLIFHCICLHNVKSYLDLIILKCWVPLKVSVLSIPFICALHHREMASKSFFL
jgi:hypothetical protein